MALTTLDQFVAGMVVPRDIAKGLTGTLVAGRPHSTLYLAGTPGAGIAPTPGIGGEVLTTLSGQVPFTNPSSGNTYLTFVSAMASQAGMVYFLDRLWQNSSLDVTSTAEQTFTGSAQIPARDANGTNAGDGVYAAVEVSTVTGAGTPTLTFKYTNQAGTTGQTGTNIQSTVASSIAGTFHMLGLAAGDKGVRQATSLTLSATWTSGTIHLVLYRVLAALPVLAGTGNALDGLSLNFPRLYDNTVPFVVFVPNTTTSSNIIARMGWAQG